MNRSSFVVFVVVLLQLLVGSWPAAAQTGISQEQIRMFQSLPPAQQQALMRQFGINPGSLSMPSSTPPENQPDVPFDFELPEFLSEPVDDTLRIEGGDTIVVTTKLKENLEPDEARAFMADVNRSRFLGNFLRVLDKRGALVLRGMDAIPLAGLSADEVAIRLEAEPLLNDLDVDVTILPVTPTGQRALEPFGYRLFGDYEKRRTERSGSSRSFDALAGKFDGMPGDAIPVPRDYVLGPGDVVNVQLYGNENETLNLVVNRDGTISFPKLGPRPVAGLTFGELKDQIEQRIAEQLIGTEAAVTMGQLRTIRIFVVGDVKRPGAYTVSSLARITNSLFYAGGITEIGSLRHVQLKRDGRTVTTLDLYDLLLRGDTSNDAQLRANDVVFVPPTDFQVAVDGEIKRPAIYEIRDEQTVQQVLDLAGGLLPTADATAVQLKRVDRRGTRDIETLNLLKPSGAATTVQAGDLVSIFPVVEDLEDAVKLSGHTPRAGVYEWQPGMRLTDLLPDDSYLLPKADLSYVLIRRETGSERRTVVLSTDLGQARANPSSPANVPLEPRDRVTIFELGIARSAAMAKILDELQTQATHDNTLQMVQVGGQVVAPGRYPLEAGMRISDLLRAGGGLGAAAYTQQAELRRFLIDPDGTRHTELIDINLAAVESGEAANDLYLQPYDYLNVKEVPAWKHQFTVELVGEVRFPGSYPVRKGETLRSVLERAGGLTQTAFPEGSVFTRASLREREAEQLKNFERRLRSDLAALGLRAAADPSGNAQQAMSVGQSLLEQIHTTKPTGRLVIDLNKLVATDSEDFDVVLRDGDKLYVPQRSQEVMVLGEVQYATSHLYAPGQSRDAYINLSGGLTANADGKHIYVVRANGAVHAKSSSRWFRSGGGQMHPGDTVVVPIKTDRVPTVVQWASITQVLYNLAIAVAAVNSF